MLIHVTRIHSLLHSKSYIHLSKFCCINHAVLGKGDALSAPPYPSFFRLFYFFLLSARRATSPIVMTLGSGMSESVMLKPQSGVPPEVLKT